MGLITRSEGGFSKAKIGSLALIAGGLLTLAGKFLTGEISDLGILINDATTLLIGFMGYGIRDAQDR